MLLHSRVHANQHKTEVQASSHAKPSVLNATVQLVTDFQDESQQKDPKESVKENVAFRISFPESRENLVKLLSMCKHSIVTIVSTFLSLPAAMPAPSCYYASSFLLLC